MTEPLETWIRRALGTLSGTRARLPELRSNHYRLNPITVNSGFDFKMALLPELVLYFLQTWPREHQVDIWRLDFENLVLVPLHALRYFNAARFRASDAISCLIYSLEEPVAEHEERLTDVPTDALTEPIVQLALGELHDRRNRIRELRKLPEIRRDGDEFDISIYSMEYRVAVMRWGMEQGRLEALSSQAGMIDVNSGAEVRHAIEVGASDLRDLAKYCVGAVSRTYKVTSSLGANGRCYLRSL